MCKCSCCFVKQLEASLHDWAKETCADLLLKLDVDQMRLRAIGLPIRVVSVIAKELNTVPRLCTGDAPHCKLANISAGLVDCQLCLVCCAFCNKVTVSAYACMLNARARHMICIEPCALITCHAKLFRTWLFSSTISRTSSRKSEHKLPAAVTAFKTI